MTSSYFLNEIHSICHFFIFGVKLTQNDGSLKWIVWELQAYLPIKKKNSWVYKAV